MVINDFYEKKHFDLVNIAAWLRCFKLGILLSRKILVFLSPFATHIWRLKRSLECYHFSVDNCHIPISVSGTRILESHQDLNLKFGIQTSDPLNVRFGRTVWPNFYFAVRPKWKNFFLQNTELFYHIQCQRLHLMIHMYVALSLVFM